MNCYFYINLRIDFLAEPLPFRCFSCVDYSIQRKIILGSPFEDSLIAQPLQRLVPRDYRHDIGRAEVESGSVGIFVFWLSIQMAVQDRDCVDLGDRE